MEAGSFSVCGIQRGRWGDESLNITVFISFELEPNCIRLKITAKVRCKLDSKRGSRDLFLDHECTDETCCL